MSGSYKFILDLDWIGNVTPPLASADVAVVSRTLRRDHERDRAGDRELRLLATVRTLLLRVEELEAERDEALKDIVKLRGRMAGEEEG